MGYRSEVHICIKKEDYEELLSRIEILKDDDIRSLIEYANKTELVNAIVISFNDVKWDSEYKDVDFIMGYLSELEEKGKPYSYVRLGEEYGDIERMESYGESDDDYSCDHISPYQGVEIY